MPAVEKEIPVCFQDFFKGKKVLVTGHTGFKGSWLSLWLTALGAQVTGFALPPPTEPSLFSLLGLEKDIRHVTGDIRDLERLVRLFKETRPEIVFHLAAQAIVRDSYGDPKTTFDVNVGGTVNFLEAVRISQTVKTAVIITSDKCYKNHEWVWAYRENDQLGGADPYSASKGAAEIICAAYQKSFFDTLNQTGKGLATARAGNVIGGGDWAQDRIIPDCIKSIIAGKPMIIRNPESIRPWQYVLDPLSGYLLLAQKLSENPAEFSGAWNFGPLDHEYITVGQLTARFLSSWPGPFKVITPVGKNDKKESFILKLNVDKAVSLLGWNPVFDLSPAIDWTGDWYKKWSKKKNMRKESIVQIFKYTEEAVRKNQVWVRQ
jgi:CDP-glucose 4,6-dehydratase